MKTTIRNIAAVVLGIVIGGAVNMALIIVGPTIVPPPDGVDVTSVESLSASMHLFEAKHFLFPFLAHAGGTLVGAVVAYFTAASHRTYITLGIGVFFLLGGITNAFMLPAPAWFVVLDLVGAYVPMGVLALWIGRRVSP